MKFLSGDDGAGSEAPGPVPRPLHSGPAERFFERSDRELRGEPVTAAADFFARQFADLDEDAARVSRHVEEAMARIGEPAEHCTTHIRQWRANLDEGLALGRGLGRRERP